MKAVIVFFALSPALLADPLQVSGRSYNPSCPGYFSVALFDGDISYQPADSLLDQVQNIVMSYSFREAWRGDSWNRPVQTLAFQRQPSGTWTANLQGQEVAARGSYSMSHLELAIQIQLINGDVMWDNGGLAPLGFYSAALPAIQCHPSAMEPLVVESKASENY